MCLRQQLGHDERCVKRRAYGTNRDLIDRGENGTVHHPVVYRSPHTAMGGV